METSDQLRLSAEDFGSEKPMADNNSEEGKAQNHRVELVKNNVGFDNP